MSEINSWDDWFSACEAYRPQFEKYEQLVRKWERCRVSDKGLADVNFARRHDRSFWKQDGKLPSGKQIKAGVIGLAAGVLIGYVWGIVSMVMAGDALVLTAPILRAVILGLVGLAVGFLPLFLQQKSLESKMGKMEPDLAEFVQFMPPKYRSSQMLLVFIEISTAYNISSFDQAVDVIDDWIKNNRRAYVPIQILFDVPTIRRAADGSFRAPEKEAGEDEINLTIPGMPQDIESHVAEGVEDAMAALEKLIGMDAVKEQVRQMRARVEFYGDAKAGQGGGNHCCFLGNAGTGKTTIARIITRMFYDFGYISRNRVVEVDGEYLKSPYVGQTGERTSAIVQAAMGGVLFIDEAYLLFNEKSNSSVGAEATGVLLKAMEDHAEDFIVIFAGYQSEVNRLLASNPGFNSRIKHKIYFDDYSAAELVQVFDLFMAEAPGGVHGTEDGAKALLESYFEAARELPGFGNARAARNAYSHLLDIHADRVISGAENVRDKVTEADVEAYIELERKRMAADGRNFMATSHLDESIISMAELESRTRDGSENPWTELNTLIGMDGAKAELEAFKARSEFFRAEGGSDETFNANVVLEGAAGTGKSTLARILCGILFELGYIRERRYLDITGDFLKASYVGQTGKRTEAAVEYAKGMMLFIDEAYLLDTAGEGGHDFGAEALGVLVNAMEKSRALVVVMAGYEREMESMLERNPGMKSRIGTYLHLADYDAKQLCQVFQLMAYQRGFSCERDIWQPLATYVSPRIGGETWGNAREARQLVEDTVTAHIMRLSRKEIDESKRKVLDAADLAAALANKQ